MKLRIVLLQREFSSLSSLQDVISSKHNKGRVGEEQKQNDKMNRK